MIQRRRFFLVYICMGFCLLTESKLSSTYFVDDEELSTNENEVFSQIFTPIKPQWLDEPEIKRQLINHQSYDVLSNNILGITSIDNLAKINKLDEFDSLTEKQIDLDRLLLENTLKEVEDRFGEERRKKSEEMAKHISTFNSEFHGCSKDPYPASKSRTIKKYQIDLDSRPEERWKEVVKQYSVQIKSLADLFETTLGPKVMYVIDKLITLLHQTLPKEYFLELSGIAEETGINIGRVTLYNVFYEFFSLCTSIVLEGEDGRMYHGRNLDFGIIMGWDSKNHTWFVTEVLRPLIVEVDFLKSGQLLYSAVTYAGYTGILTGVKKNTFSLTIDERFVLDGGYVGIIEWIKGQRDMSWLGLLTRQVMETAQSYQQAQKVLAHTPLVAPAYFILAGPSHQGCIVTRGRRDFDVWELGSKHKGQNGSWYLLETNYDHWVDPPFFDQRRKYAVQCMDELGRQKPLETLYRVLSTKPVLNTETTLTAVMDVKEGLLQVWERECPGHCWPF